MLPAGWSCERSARGLRSGRGEGERSADEAPGGARPGGRAAAVRVDRRRPWRPLPLAALSAGDPGRQPRLPRVADLAPAGRAKGFRERPLRRRSMQARLRAGQAQEVCGAGESEPAQAVRRDSLRREEGCPPPPPRLRLQQIDRQLSGRTAADIAVLGVSMRESQGIGGTPACGQPVGRRGRKPRLHTPAAACRIIPARWGEV